MSASKSIAFFDFDGTITNKDIFGDFIAYRLRHVLPVWRLLPCLPYIVLYKLKLMSNETAKERIFSLLFKGEKQETFKTHVVDYVANHLPRRLRRDALARLEWHKAQGHDIYIVSANFDILLDEFTRLHHIKHLSTRIHIDNGLITGKFASANCYGPQKVVRIKAQLPNLSDYATIYAYGDSDGDKEMLALSTDRFYRYFKE